MVFGRKSKDSPDEAPTQEPSPVLTPEEARLQTLKAQRAERLAVRPGRLTHAFVNRPKLVCLLSLLVPILATVAIVALRLFQFNSPGGNMFFIRDDLRTIENTAREAAREEFVRSVDPILEDVTAISASSVASAPTGSDGGDTQVPATVRQADSDPERSIKEKEWDMIFLYRAPDEDGNVVNDAEQYEDGTNVLTPKFVAEMKRLEDLFVNSKDFDKYCLYDSSKLGCDGEVPTCALYSSITTHPKLYGIVDENTGLVCGVRDTSEPVSQEDFDAFLSEIVQEDSDGVRRVQSSYTRYLGSEVVNGTVPETFITSAVFSFGKPLEGYPRADEDTGDQQAEYEEWLVETMDIIRTDADEANVLVMVPSGSAFVNTYILQVLITDFALAGVSILLVLLCIWFHTGSLFLAVTAMIQVILAFPLAYFVYAGPLRVEYFSTLQILTIFLILGIAADDVFVFTDAWKQAAVVLGPNVDLERRMSWTYNRAVRAMCVTSFTTATAFFVSAISPIMPISTLGIWSGALILAQFALVITVYPCATVMWHRSLMPRKFSNGFKLPSPPQLVTAEDDLNVERNGGDGDAEDGALPKTSSVDDTAGPIPAEEERKVCGLFKKRAAKQKDAGEYRAVERFFYGPWSKFLHKGRFIILPLSVVLFCVSLYFATKIPALSEAEEFLPEDNEVTIATSLLSSAFPTGGSDFSVRVTLIWGLEGLDRSGTSKYEPEDNGRAILDDTFDLKKAEAQQAMLVACEEIEKETGVLVSAELQEPAECWIRDFKTWREATDRGTEFETYESDKALVDEIKEFAAFIDPGTGTTPFVKYIQSQTIMFELEPEERVVAAELTFETDVASDEPYEVMWPFYSDWVDKVEELNGDAPDSANKSFAVAGEPWMFQITQDQLVTSAITGLIAMLFVALVILIISTLNVVVSVLATLCVAGIVVNVLMIIQLLGWELGTVESVSIIIAAGIAFDFVAHLANAYVESHSKTRFERVRDALTELGVSVVFGGLSTILAGIMLFFTTILFFNKFGGFLVATIALSMLWSLTIFCAALMVVGPQGNFGSLAPLLRKLKGLFVRKNSSGEDAAHGEASEPRA